MYLAAWVNPWPPFFVAANALWRVWGARLFLWSC